MKALLMHPDRDFEVRHDFARHERDLIQDLALDTLADAMAGGDEFLLDVARAALLAGLHNDVATIRYRQEIVSDCLQNPAVVRELYGLAVQAADRKTRGYFGYLGRFPSSILHGSLELLEMSVGILEELTRIAEQHAGRFESSGFSTLFAMLRKELTREYVAGVRHHLAALKFRDGMLLSAKLGTRTEGTNYVLRQAPDIRPRWFERLLGKASPAYTVRIHERDEAGARALSELRDRGINLVANAAAQSADHIASFLAMLRTELAFYVCCLNLHDRLARLGVPICLPQPEAAGARTLRFDELYDVSLALRLGRPVVSNSVDADRKRLVIITGANQGGKSSFLRAVGLAQMMMQCGMFVGAASFAAELCAGLLTHYKREEDATMEQGKLDEELGRMSNVVDALAPNAMLLLNESFAATNEREGSEIAGQVVCALLEKGVKIIFVTHLYEFAHSFFTRQQDEALFLRPERRADGTRTFRLIPGEPLETSYGEDVYRTVFAATTGEMA